VRPFDRRLWRESATVRRYLVLAGLLEALAAAATIAQAALLAHTIVGGFLRHRSVASLTPELVGLGALTVARAGVAWLLESAGRILALRVTSELRARVLAHVVRTRPGGVSTAEVTTATTDGARALEPYFARFLPQLLAAAIAPPAIIAFVLWEDVTSAVIMLVTLPLIPLFGILIGRAAQARAMARYEALARMSSHFLDVVSGLATLRAFRRGRAQTRTIEDVTEAYRRETMGTLRIAFLSALVLELAATLGTAVIAVEIGVRLVDGRLGLEPALACLILAPELYGPLRLLASQFHASTDGLTAAGRLFALLELEPAVALPSTRVEPRFGTIRFETVAKSFAGRGSIFEALSFTVEPGEHVALVAPSGAGKSTLLSILLRFADPDQGAVTVGGVDLRTLDPAEWRRLVSWLPQRPRLQPGPVSEAISLGRPGVDVGAAAVLAGASALLGRTVGEGGLGLSAGELRRVALARALASPAPLLLLDEPTTHLDPDTAADVRRALGSVGADRTLVVATHDLDLAAVVDRVVELPAPRAPGRAQVAA
jgi:ATP-binding cassette, subfamily C, bacterial CydD